MKLTILAIILSFNVFYFLSVYDASTNSEKLAIKIAMKQELINTENTYERI